MNARHVPLALTRRRHIDLARVTGTGCRVTGTGCR
ncbi:putative leader peptide [Streptomyces sp. NPDC004284]